MVETAARSFNRVTAIVLSSEPERSFERVGKCNAVMCAECWRRVPSSLFRRFSEMVFLPSEGMGGSFSFWETGEADRLKTLTFSSEPPDAK